MTMFSKIKAQLDVTGKTAEFELFELEGDPKPVVILAPASIDNAGYFNASLRYSGNRVKGKQPTEKEQIEAGLQEMRELWPDHVIKGWRHILTDAGEEVGYTPELGGQLLDALPRDVLVRMKLFAQDMQNFRRGDLPPVDVETVSGN